MLQVPLRVLVGTLYSAEKEFMESRNSALKQQYCRVDHYVIKDLNEYDAHNLLWKVLNSRTDSYDLFVKLDADTILGKLNLFHTVHERLISKSLDGIQLSLLDYYSQSSIYGLGIFLPRVRFMQSRSRLFADRAIDRQKFKIGRNQDIGFLEDAGFHCSYPSAEQSYRYGLHRWKKGQLDLMRLVLQNWILERDSARGWALIGAIMAEKKRFISVNYGGQNFQKIASLLKSKSDLERWISQNIHCLNLGLKSSIT